MSNLIEFLVVTEPDEVNGGIIYRAELVGSGPEVPFGYGASELAAIQDLCESMTAESETE
jgi:hypothetical protein